jgi:hypothetical protein
MHTPCIDTAVSRGLDRVTLADLRLSEHPDRRFAYLRRRSPNWLAVQADLDRVMKGDESWPRLRDLQTLTADAFRPR